VKRLYIDIETYSPVDIKRGVYKYSEDPAFTVLMAAWALDDGPIQVAVGEDEIRRIPGLFAPIDSEDVERVAHNAQFERVCLSRLGGLPVGEYLPASEWLDTMACMAEWGYPQSLKSGAQALGAAPKDEAGTRLIRLFCSPDRRGARKLPADHPDQWDEFVRYCVQDVETMRDMLHRLEAQYGAWPTSMERRIYDADQRVNDAGIRVDLALARAAIDAADRGYERDTHQAQQLTGLANPRSVQQLLAWLGGALPDLRAETVRDALDGDSLTPVQRQVLELRQSMSLTAHKKFGVALEAASPDGRLRGGFRFFSAHTGRWAGRGLQMQNLPRDGFDSEAQQNAAIADTLLGADIDPHTLKSLVRPLMVGPFTVCDYSAIEARVVAWLAGEDWALEAFAAGRDIYVETARRMGGGMTRREGKIAVLALGYGGGIGSLKAMGGERLGSDQLLQQIVDQWRGANQRIVALWGLLERAFLYGGMVGDRLWVEARGEDRLVWLPSGRPLVYHGVRASRVGGRQRLSFVEAKSGARRDTYGGRLAENATQAVARDVLGEALVRLDNAGARVVGHVHDEVLVEGADSGSVDWVRGIMTREPVWGEGLPLDAAGYVCGRYRKE
jgi:DNA polymerase